MARSPYVIEYRGAFSFPCTPDEVWSAMQRFDRFECWWGWLREFRVEGPGLEGGSVFHGVVVPPLPYRLGVLEEASLRHVAGCRVRVTDLVPARSAWADYGAASTFRHRQAIGHLRLEVKPHCFAEQIHNLIVRIGVLRAMVQNLLE